MMEISEKLRELADLLDKDFRGNVAKVVYDLIDIVKQLAWDAMK